jgi:hypothetical protein
MKTCVMTPAVMDNLIATGFSRWTPHGSRESRLVADHSFVATRKLNIRMVQAKAAQQFLRDVAVIG